VNVRTAVVAVVAATGVAALVSAWGVSVTLTADDATKPLVQTAFVACGIVCIILAALIWRRSRPPTPN
jgi:ABC-type proline/glycine betaine transport system permease subunit